MKFKIAEYNILDGIHTFDEPHKFQKERLQQLKQIIKSLNPDILVLAEACSAEANKHGVDVDYKKEFGFPHHFHAFAVSGKQHGNSLLSRYPIVSAENYSVYQRKFGRVEVKMGKKIVTIDIIHPHPSLTEIERTQFLTGVLRDMKTPYIIAGDFNTWSEEDMKGRDLTKIAQTLLELSPNRKEDKTLFMENMEKQATCQATNFVKSKGLIDTYRAVHKKGFRYTVPTDSCSMDKGAASRIDYIFCSKEFKVLDAGIVKNDLAEEASDHYPIYADLELK